MLNASLYFHTLRYLRPQQIAARLRFRLSKPIPRIEPPPERAPQGGLWVIPPERRGSLLGPSKARFLNRERELIFPQTWNDDPDKLWLYQLHYFDDLNAQFASARKRWHRELIAAWIRDNAPASGVGWEPYPVSMRAVNWIKYVLSGSTLEGGAIASLATQLRYLHRRVEWHLLANHLFANGKALLFGGVFFRGAEPDDWLDLGAAILEEQLAEQILLDGGHFERSPMYHALALQDVLDVMNLLQAFPKRAFSRRSGLLQLLPKKALAMLGWLQAMTHPDGEIAFFNDAALDVALPPASLLGYAARLGIPEPTGAQKSTDLDASGYVRLQEGDWCAFFDAAAVGPDYQPGHAHADTLSFELSLDWERVISNSGTSTYRQDEQRTYERSTRAHNTVEIDGKDSSEVWATFRVARRARPIQRKVDIAAGRAFASCAHDGYTRLRGRPLHRRSIEITAPQVRWTDRVEGSGRHRVRGAIPLHPGLRAAVDGSSARLTTASGKRLVVTGRGIPGFSVVEGFYGREFGLLEPRQVLVWEIEGTLPMEAAFALQMDPM